MAKTLLIPYGGGEKEYIQGAQGATGAQGAVGLQGEIGIQGTNGLQGANGAQGATGEQGVQGATGGTAEIQSLQASMEEKERVIAFALNDLAEKEALQGIQGATGAQGATGPAISTQSVTLQFTLDDDSQVNYNVFIDPILGV